MLDSESSLDGGQQRSPRYHQRCADCKKQHDVASQVHSQRKVRKHETWIRPVSQELSVKPCWHPVENAGILRDTIESTKRILNDFYMHAEKWNRICAFKWHSVRFLKQSLHSTMVYGSMHHVETALRHSTHNEQRSARSHLSFSAACTDHKHSPKRTASAASLR
jgi:hypothetical protein